METQQATFACTPKAQLVFCRSGFRSQQACRAPIEQEALMTCRAMPVLFVAASGLVAMASASAELPGSTAATGETAVVTFHAEGTQIYECKTAPDGKLAWQFREPVATLLLDGKTVGRHYAGPSWAHVD